MELKHYVVDAGINPRTLLIVPYGIETPRFLTVFITIPAFNRTLWN